MLITTRSSPYVNVVRRTAGVPAATIVVEQAPPGQLEHAAAHQRVGGERVGAERAAVDDEQRRGRARASSMAVAAPAARAPTTMTS